MHPIRTRAVRRVAIGATALAIGGTMIGVTTAPFPAPAPETPPSSLVTALAAVTGDPTELGVGDAQVYRMSHDELVITIDDLYRLGVRAIRIGAPWSFLQQGDSDTAAWETLDTVIEEARAHGMDVAVVISLTSLWTGSADPVGVAERFTVFAKRLAGRYKGKVSAYEIWDDPTGQGPTLPMTPEAMGSLLEAALAAVVATDPSVRVSARSIHPQAQAVLESRAITTVEPSVAAAVPEASPKTSIPPSAETPKPSATDTPATTAVSPTPATSSTADNEAPATSTTTESATTTSSPTAPSTPGTPSSEQPTIPTVPPVSPGAFGGIPTPEPTQPEITPVAPAETAPDGG
ncbi:hypothetical protein [Gordonia sp. NPDC003376]